MPIAQINGRPILLTPSILAADFARLGEQACAAESAGADWIQIDVMDGMFVPNISVGLPVVEALRRAVQLTLDCHLMINQPERYVDAFVQAGADHVTVHAEATVHLHRTIEQIRAAGATAGVALNPATPLGVLDEILPMVDLVLLMSVNPGFGGQAYIPTTTGKIARLRRILDERGLSGVHLQVDGGIKAENICELALAGATNLVVGTGIYNGDQHVVQAFDDLRRALSI